MAPPVSGAAQVGKINPAEVATVVDENHADEQRAGNERQQIQDEVGEQPPFLQRICHQEDRVERQLLSEQVGAGDQRRENHGTGRSDAGRAALDRCRSRAQHNADQSETQHRQADNKRAEMSPATDREDAHHRKLQRDDSTCVQPD